MKIYLAGRYSLKDHLRKVAVRLREQGHTITSSWLETEWNDDPFGSSAAPPEKKQEFALKDMEDLSSAECIIAYTEPPRSGGRGGRHVEFGIALALGHRLIVVGPRENIFYYHPKAEVFDYTGDMIKALKEATHD